MNLNDVAIPALGAVDVAFDDPASRVGSARHADAQLGDEGVEADGSGVARDVGDQVRGGDDVDLAGQKVQSVDRGCGSGAGSG